MLTATDRTPGTLTHTYLSSPCAYEIPPWGKAMLSKSLVFPQSKSSTDYGSTAFSKALCPYSSTKGLACLSNPGALCLPLLFSPLTKHHTLKPPALHSLVFNLSVCLNDNPITSLNSLQDVHLYPLWNDIVNDLRGVNHSQDNGCKKLIDMIFMI